MLRNGMRFFNFILFCYALSYLAVTCGTRRQYEEAGQVSVASTAGREPALTDIFSWGGQKEEDSAGNLNLQPLAALPEKFETMLVRGQMLVAILLCSKYSNKEKGANMKPGELADLKMPDGGVRRPKLLARTGFKEVVPLIWCGDESVEDRTVYVAFTPMSSLNQAWRIFSRGQTLVNDSVQVPGGSVRQLRISDYLKAKLDKLWSEQYRFGELMAQVVADYPTHQIVFTGISHGAALAQAAALRFCLLDPGSAPRVNVVTWNSYKWTDAAGSALADEVLHDRILPLVLSRDDPRRWDSAAEYPSATSGFEPMPNLLLLDIDIGVFFGNVDLPKTFSFGWNSLSRARELHLAKMVIPAVKKAMNRSLQLRLAKSDDNNDDECEGTSDTGSTASELSPLLSSVDGG
eukprot:TRINITY_DN7711_c0_g1_i1.p1 TRINITY_DN7711_c0_g1~~TRINITY_DN7711_c0_g1_i1.p1  ORF type:complete len:405 (+),score=85.16 TRINITY_DN7711_c0_g1_i1:55-1269(+)